MSLLTELCACILAFAIKILRPRRSNGHRNLPATLAAPERYSPAHRYHRPITHRRLLRLLFPGPRTWSDSRRSGDFARSTTNPDLALIRATVLALTNYRTRLRSIRLNLGRHPKHRYGPVFSCRDLFWFGRTRVHYHWRDFAKSGYRATHRSFAIAILDEFDPMHGDSAVRTGDSEL
jgi:hypothetical protein